MGFPSSQSSEDSIAYCELLTSDSFISIRRLLTELEVQSKIIFILILFYLHRQLSIINRTMMIRCINYILHTQIFNLLINS